VAGNTAYIELPKPMWPQVYKINKSPFFHTFRQLLQLEKKGNASGYLQKSANLREERFDFDSFSGGDYRR
jgi:hypothetical protein